MQTSIDGPAPKADEATLDLLRKRAKKSLFFFAKGILGFDWFNLKIHGPICQMLEREDNHNLLFVLPRGWQKSTLISICYPLWKAINNPAIRIIIVQNSQANADKKLGLIRTIVEKNDLFRSLWPELLPTSDCTWTNNCLKLNRNSFNAEGTFESAGKQARITGRHYDEAIEDDTVSPDLDDLTAMNVMPSRDDIEQAIGYHKSLIPLLEGSMRSRRIVVGTRWAQRDLISHVIETEGKFFKVYIRAVRETNGIPDAKGSVVYPERFNSAKLAELEAGLGPYLYACNYLNTPLDSAEMIFKDSWFKNYLVEPQDIAIYTTVDLVPDPKNIISTDPDFFVCLTTGKSLSTGIIHVLEYTRVRCNPSEQVAIIFDHNRKWHPLQVGIGAMGYENTIKHWCEERMRREGIYFVVEILRLGNGAKNARIMGLQPLYSSNTIQHRTGMRELESELLAFPNGSHDDIIDALSMQLQLWALSNVGSGVKPDKDAGFDNFNVAYEEMKALKRRENIVETYRELLDNKVELAYEMN